MLVKVLSYDARTRIALLGRAGGGVLLKLTNVTLEQAQKVTAGLSRHWRAADEKRDQPEGIYFARSLAE